MLCFDGYDFSRKSFNKIRSSESCWSSRCWEGGREIQSELTETTGVLEWGIYRFWGHILKKWNFRPKYNILFSDEFHFSIYPDNKRIFTAGNEALEIILRLCKKSSYLHARLGVTNLCTCVPSVTFANFSRMRKNYFFIIIIYIKCINHLHKYLFVIVKKILNRN